MRYRIDRQNHLDFDVFEINKRPGRAYFIPYSEKETLVTTPLSSERYSSDLVRVLSGEWDFKYYRKKSLIPEVFDTDTLKFDKINVPSTWQRVGYEPPVYLNTRYEFETRPPKLPDEFSAGVYRKFFTVDDIEKKYILSFLGVIPCIDLYINGEFAGYSEGAHNTAEFDISSYLKSGENELVAVVHKWCTGTYLECQDMFRENGIFRDVLLYQLPDVHINDFRLKTEKTKNGWSLDVLIELEGKLGLNEYELALSLVDRYTGKEIAGQTLPAANTTATVLQSLNVSEWSAEIPVVYDFFITLLHKGNEVETLRNITGFKQIKIIKDVFTFNDTKIKVKGVNHHDTHPVTGYVMSFADLEKDIKLMKSLNVNGVRTSHYPPDPHLLVLCDIYGLYVIDEADIETHGCGSPPHFRINLISNNAKWIPHYVDRVSRMYYRDRNHPSILMWSLGNEAGGHKCQDACYEFLNEFCPEIPVHYEGVIHTRRHSYDVVSEMYTSTDDMIKILNGTRGRKYKNKPFYLCEYCHAMGVGPGALEEYWDIMYSSDIFMGGCIWEWADHAVYHKNGPLKYTYGGDHGERKHDGNFCVDGLVYPDRTLHTGAKAMKAVYRPVRASKNEDGSFTFKNTNSFKNADYISVNWELLTDGVSVQSGSFGLDIEPLESQIIKLDINDDFADNTDLHINFSYFDKDGNNLAIEQLALNESKTTVLETADSGEIAVVESSENLTVRFSDGKIIFNMATGMFERYLFQGRDLISQSPADCKGPVPNIFRALLDNDARMRDKWLKAGYDDISADCFSFIYTSEDKNVCVEAEFNLMHKRKVLYKARLVYNIYSSGLIKLTAELSTVNANRFPTDIPRFGVMIEMPREFENAEYFAFGPYENLNDFKAHTTLGIYESRIRDFHEPYVKPQDNGNRSFTRWLKVTDNDGHGLMFLRDKEFFSFSAHHYTQKLLQGAKHQEDLTDQNITAISIDGFMRGTGTSSCGQDTLPKYRIDAEDGLEFSFYIKPIKR